MKFLVSDTFGSSVELNRNKIHKVLANPYEGFAHVYAHDPKMVIINRIKWKGIWSLTVEELYDDGVENTPLISVYCVTFKDEDIDAAIELFLALIKTQRKDFERYMRKRLGKNIILADISRKIHSDCHDFQKYVHEALRDNVKRSLGRRRSARKNGKSR
jgi:hypothetical protein